MKRNTRAATYVLSPGLLVVHDAGRGGEDHLAERARGQQEGAPVLDRVDRDVEAGRDDAALVEAAVQLDDNLAAAVVVDNLELADVACRGRQRCLLLAGLRTTPAPKPGPEPLPLKGRQKQWQKRMEWNVLSQSARLLPPPA